MFDQNAMTVLEGPQRIAVKSVRLPARGALSSSGCLRGKVAASLLGIFSLAFKNILKLQIKNMLKNHLFKHLSLAYKLLTKLSL